MSNRKPTVFHFFESENQIHSNSFAHQFYLKKGNEIFLNNSNYIAERVILKPTSSQKNICVLLKSGPELSDRMMKNLTNLH